MIQPQILPFNNLRGINTKKSVTQRLPNEANISIDGFFDKTGAFITRRGFRRINSTEIGTDIDLNSVCQFSDLAIVSGSTFLISLDLNSLVETVLSSTLTGSFFDFEEYMPEKVNYLVMTNGQDFPFKFNGTALTNLSIATPLTEPTLTPAGGGSLTPSAVYQVAVTYIRDNGDGEVQESNPCDTVEVTLGGGDTRISMSAIPVSPDTQVTGRRIYLSRPNGSILYRQGEITNNVATTYNIDTNVDVLVNVELEYDHDPAPKCYLIEKFGSRLVLAGDPTYPGRVYVSKANDVWYFPQGELAEDVKNYFEIGETVTSIKSYYSIVFVFGINGNMYVLSGSDESNFSIDQIKNDQRVTALSDRATIVFDNWCYFLSFDGYYRTNTQIIEKVSEPISTYFDPENQQDNQYNVSGFSYGFNQIVPVAVYFKPNNQILLWITQSGQNDYVNNICFVLHLSNLVMDNDELAPNYSIYRGMATRCTSQLVIDNYSKYFLVSQHNGFLFQAEKGKYGGAAINSTVTSAGATTLVDTTQVWTVNTYAELWVTIRSGTGAGQINRIVSNTADTLTVAVTWSITPDSSSTYSIGGISWTYVHSYNSYGNDSLSKRLIFIRPRFVSEGDATVKISFGYDFSDTETNDLDELTVNISGSSLWDVAQWDEAKWDGPTVYQDKLPAHGSRIHRWATIKVQNLLADQSVEYDGHDKIFQIKGVR